MQEESRGPSQCQRSRREDRRPPGVPTALAVVKGAGGGSAFPVEHVGHHSTTVLTPSSRRHERMTQPVARVVMTTIAMTSIETGWPTPTE